MTGSGTVERLPDDEAQADMYLCDRGVSGGRTGYEQYEISNFARPGHASRHNLKYWTLGEYAGFGPGAHSDFGGVRYGYIRDLDRYIAGELVLAEIGAYPRLGAGDGVHHAAAAYHGGDEHQGVRETASAGASTPWAHGWRFTPTTAWPSGRSRAGA